MFPSQAAFKRYFNEKQERLIQAGKLEQFDEEMECYHQIKDEIRDHLPPLEMLLGLSSINGREWGDMGFLQFFIRRQDLIEKRFDRVWMVGTSG
jgi:uncharacterized protein YwqG